MLIGITGATGFIGSALAQHHLERGDAVRCLSRQRSPGCDGGMEIVQGDLAAPDLRLEPFVDGLDVLYHCAGEHSQEQRMRAVNVHGTAALLTAAAGRIGRWVQLSSAGVYGRHREGIVTEETPLTPQGEYETTKAEADRLVIDAVQQGRINSVAVLRPTIVFGAGMPNRSLAQMVSVIERGRFFFIGRRGASANYVHVSNVVDALVLCGVSAHAAGRVYNLSDWTTVEEFARAIADALGRPQPRLRVPEGPIRMVVAAIGRLVALPLTPTRIDALVNRTRYAIDRIRRELDYVPRVSIPAGLADLVARR
jgi:nucleoside-diphosphate-sugar epimerase